MHRSIELIQTIYEIKQLEDFDEAQIALAGRSSDTLAPREEITALKSNLNSQDLIDENQNPCGSLIVLEAGSLGEARGIAESDPYLVEGVFEGERG